jgi:hypothetical protein
MQFIYGAGNDDAARGLKRYGAGGKKRTRTDGRLIDGLSSLSGRQPCVSVPDLTRSHEHAGIDVA